MGKLSGNPQNTAPSLTDWLVSIKNPGSTPADVNVTIAAALALLASGTPGTTLSQSLQNYVPTVTSITGGTDTPQTSYYIDLGGLLFAFVNIGVTASATAAHLTGIQLPSGFFTNILCAFPGISAETVNFGQTNSIKAISNVSIEAYLENTANTATATMTFFVFGN